MKFNFNLIPALSGRFSTDIRTVADSFNNLICTLKQAFTKLDDSNIISLSASKLNGGVIDTDIIKLEGGVLKVTSDSFVLANSDWSQYVELSSDGNITMCVDTIEVNHLITSDY